MRRTPLPTTGELQAFVACARLGTTVLAAERLGRTQSAVSRAICGLEDRLGAALFVRARQRLSLSAAGRQLLPEAEAALGALEAAALGVMAHGGAQDTLRIAALPSFARAWLIPRLPRFAARHGAIRIDLAARLGAPEFAREPFDLAILRSAHAAPGAQSVALLPERLVAVIAPSGLPGGAPLALEALAARPLLQQSTRPSLWLDWFREGEADPRRILRGARVEHFDMVIDMAAAGLGVGLVPEVLAEGAIAAGRLAVAHPRRLDTGEHYTLVTPPGAQARAPVRAFCDWIGAEIARP